MLTTSIQLPSSPLDPCLGRLTVFESTEGPEEAWRIASLADGRYTFELDAHGVTLMCEPHRSLIDALARLDAWRRRLSVGRAA